MSRYVFQYFVLLIAALLFTSWQRRNRGKPAPIRNGFHVVRWPLTLRLIAGAFFIMVLTIEPSLIWAKFTTDENIPGVIWVLAIPPDINFPLRSDPGADTRDRQQRLRVVRQLPLCAELSEPGEAWGQLVAFSVIAEIP
jgi:hypothetical protein